jgi:hypothetical protein
MVGYLTMLDCSVMTVETSQGGLVAATKDQLSKPAIRHCQRFPTTKVVTLKMLDRGGNVVENKGALWKTWGRSGNVYENKGDIC